MTRRDPKSDENAPEHRAPAKRIAVVVASEFGVARDGLRALLDREHDLCVVGEATPDRLVAIVERLAPDIVVVDPRPLLDDHFLEAIRKVQTRTRILLVDRLPGGKRAARLLPVSVYVGPDSDAAGLVRAIRDTAPRAPSEDRVRSTATGATLTARESQVLRMSAEGLTSADVAQRLGISPRTAEAHRANAMRKLKLRNRAELVRYALVHGVIDLSTWPEETP